jgi:hypothetical protein
VARFGAIDVLEYSPYSGLDMVNPAKVTVDSLQPNIEHLLYGAVTATQSVLPAMLQARTGTLLYTTGGGAITPYPMLATTNAAQAALRTGSTTSTTPSPTRASTPRPWPSTCSSARAPPTVSRTPPRTTTPRPTGTSTPAATGPNTS